MAIDRVTEQLVAYIVKNYPGATITSLMKLSYFADLLNIKQNGNQISKFAYERYLYGPFDNRIYRCVESLISRDVINERHEYSSAGDECIKYIFNPESVYAFSSLSEKAIGVIDNMLSKLRGYGSRALTELSYKTKPMQAIGAKIGDNNNMKARLNLRA